MRAHVTTSLALILCQHPRTFPVEVLPKANQPLVATACSHGIWPLTATPTCLPRALETPMLLPTTIPWPLHYLPAPRICAYPGCPASTTRLRYYRPANIYHGTRLLLLPPTSPYCYPCCYLPRHTACRAYTACCLSIMKENESGALHCRMRQPRALHPACFHSCKGLQNLLHPIGLYSPTGLASNILLSTQCLVF